MSTTHAANVNDSDMEALWLGQYLAVEKWSINQQPYF
jgi:hypothetical protein